VIVAAAVVEVLATGAGEMHKTSTTLSTSRHLSS
jgi:hypothetical protein